GYIRGINSSSHCVATLLLWWSRSGWYSLGLQLFLFFPLLSSISRLLSANSLCPPSVPGSSCWRFFPHWGFS
ncbi:hypothetical protein NDU88_002890, partial [Pleurodeles waltl]